MWFSLLLFFVCLLVFYPSFWGFFTRIQWNSTAEKFGTVEILDCCKRKWWRWWIGINTWGRLFFFVFLCFLLFFYGFCSSTIPLENAPAWKSWNCCNFKLHCSCAWSFCYIVGLCHLEMFPLTEKFVGY